MAQSSFFSNEPECLGFDLTSGSKWIYPENYPRRDYQFSIVQTGLYNNTLVCLPTGLGKTFIAAVIMYNFWRWYPRGRVVFLAPTKPLVAQQIHACHEIMGIPSDQTIELTGAVNANKRKDAWHQKRVIFATPQTFQKDLQNNSVPCELVKCVVIDEAHKALGKHSYCEIVRMLNEKNKFFRILALSATPGSKIDHVREVIQNLLISELELRDDTSPDIVPYTNERSLEKIIVHLGRDLEEYKERYINIMDPHVRILVTNHILQTNTANISKGRIFMLMKQYDSRPQKARNHGVIMKTLNILLTMYHAYELLVKHGLRAFYNFYLHHSDKFWLDSELDLRQLLEDIKRYIGTFPVIEPLPDGSIPDVPNDIIFGHNKFNTLQQLLEKHFQKFASQNQSTRAIVFVEYRDIVNEVYVLLLQKRPLIRPQMFVGQAGQKQKQQLAALEDFRNNQVNVLISTSVGEEGLDVGEVDLIVCFDISSSTPIRLVQRMGRTGRKRNGRVVLLLTEGKEVQTLNQAMSKKDTMNAKILQSSNIASSLYQSSPRMVPEGVNPECHSMFIKSLPKTPKTKPGSSKATSSAASASADGGMAAPGPKKRGRKKKNEGASDNGTTEPQPSTSKTGPSPKKSTQSTMMRFLTTDQQRKPQTCQSSSTNIAVGKTSSSGNPNIFGNNFNDCDSGVFCEEFQAPSHQTNNNSNSSSLYDNIRPSDVLLLTSDSHALEFLTLCAMKRSELDTQQQQTPGATNSASLVDDLRDWIPNRARSDGSDQVVVDHFAGLDNLLMGGKLYDSLECIGQLTLCEVPPYNEDSLLMDEQTSTIAAVETTTMIPSPRLLHTPLPIPDYDAEDASFGAIHLESKYRRPSEVAICRSMEDLTEDRAICSAKPREARVEVDFEAILDEDSSSLENPASAEPVCNGNIFDELLEGTDDDDEDMFGEWSQDRTITNQQITDEPKAEVPLSAKRCASKSPRHDSPSKRQRLHDVDPSSDGEAILGTPPKPKIAKPEPPAAAPVTAFYANSDDDLFDDLDCDFETQFSPDKTLVKPEVSVEENKDAEMSMSAIVEAFSKVERQPIDSPKKEETRKEEIEPTKVEKKEEPAKKCNDISAIDPDLELEDWDDFELAPVLVPAPKTPNEKFSSFFGPHSNSRTNTSSSSSNNNSASSKALPAKPKPQPSTSSGWISTGRPNPQPQKKILSLKNVDKKAPPPSNGLDIQRSYRAEIGGQRPSLKFFNLNPSVSLDRDKDGFALPAQPINRAPAPEKENARPSAAILEISRRANVNPSSNVSPRFRRYHSESSLNDSGSSRQKKKKNKKKKTSRRKLAHEFLEMEADVSSDYETSEGSSGEDDDLDSFVSYTQVHEDDEEVDMRAHYLQTMNRNSPVKPGAFVIREVTRPQPPRHEIFSQPESQAEESYLNDTFCVGDETEMGGDSDDGFMNDTILENVESTLESRRNELKRKRKMKFQNFENKRKRNKPRKDSSSNSDVTNNSSSEDETEALRRQVLEESMLLKK